MTNDDAVIYTISFNKADNHADYRHTTNGEENNYWFFESSYNARMLEISSTSKFNEMMQAN